MNILKKIFQRNKVHAFPTEKNEGFVEVKENCVIIKAKNYYDLSGDFDLSMINRIYAVVNNEMNTSLALCTRQQNYCIPTHYKGFQNAYKIVSSRFGLDDSLFMDTISMKKEQKILLWRKSFEPTYSIIGTTINDYTKGFEIQSPEKEFHSWDITFNELRQSKHVEPLFPEDVHSLRFKYPVRVGKLLLPHLSAHNYDRTDIAIRFFITECYAREASDKSYHDIHQLLSEDIGTSHIINESTHEDMKWVDFQMDGIRFSIIYYYDNSYNFENGYTKLSISNEREYPALLENKPYEEVMSVSDYAIMGEDVSLKANYKMYDYPKRRPPLLNQLFGDKNIIWRDDVNEIIGFADKDISIVFLKKEIKSLFLENLKPAKGSGGSDLLVERADNSPSIFTFSGEYRSMNAFIPAIEAVTGQKVVTGVEYSDC